MIKIWEWRLGRRLDDVAIEEVVRPFIVIRRAQHKRGYDSDGERKPPTRRWLARQRRRQAKATAAAAPPEEDADTTPGAEAEAEDAEDADEDERNGSEDDAADECASPAPGSSDPGEPPLGPVLVVQRIETLRIDGRLAVVFSAVGCVSWLCLPSLSYG